MHSFLAGILGGLLIGLSAAVLLLFSGDILGASGIVNSIGLSPISSIKDPNQHWKLVLIASFFLTAHLFVAPHYEDKDNGLAGISWAAFLIGGFCVGFGTRLGNGCTSGHGICGLARLSKRSFVAVPTFMTIGIVTAILTQSATTPFPQKAFDFLRDDDNQEYEQWDMVSAVIAMILALAALIAAAFQPTDAHYNTRAKLAPAAAAGVLFCLGLWLSEMVYPVRVFGFLNLALIPDGDWDATLMFVMGGGVVVSFLSYQVVDGHSMLSKYFTAFPKPLCLEDGSNFSVPTNTIIDRDLILGAMMFGLGWGISGLCPGPAMVLAGVGVSWVLVCYWPAFFLGSYLATYVKSSKCPTPLPAADAEAEVKAEDSKTSDEHDQHHHGSTAALSLEDLEA